MISFPHKGEGRDGGRVPPAVRSIRRSIRAARDPHLSSPFQGEEARVAREVKAERNPGTPSEASTALAGFRFHLHAPRFGGLEPSEARRASAGGSLNPGYVLREQMISFPLKRGKVGMGVARRQLCVRSDAQFGRPATPTYPPPFRGRKSKRPSHSAGEVKLQALRAAAMGDVFDFFPLGSNQIHAACFRDRSELDSGRCEKVLINF
jgi:hypothetical protein